MPTANAVGAIGLHIGHVHELLVARVPDVDHGRVQSYPVIEIRHVEQLVVDTRRDQILHRAARNGCRIELPNQRACDAGIAVREMKDVRLVTLRFVGVDITKTHRVEPRHAQSVGFQCRNGVEAHAPPALDGVAQ